MSDIKLYITPVPIGNLKDITLRAIEILKKVDFIIVEDTKYSLKLLNHLDIKKPLISYYKPKEQIKTAGIIKKLKRESAALITDSGTPVISDPGYYLIRAAIDNDIEIESLPGPTAFVPALTLSGIDFSSFTFLGFPPRKTGDLTKFLTEYANVPEALVFYQSPRRVEKFLYLAYSIFGERQFAIIKELTKKNENILRGNLKDLAHILSKTKLLGEFVIIIEGQKKPVKSTIKIESIQDIYSHFKKEHNISKNIIKDIFMKRKDI